jgi:hypothetical protein
MTTSAITRLHWNRCFTEETARNKDRKGMQPEKYKSTK